MNTIDIDAMTEAELSKLAETRTLDLKRLPAPALDKLAKRLVSADRYDDVLTAYWEEVAGERRKREARTATRKAKRLEAGGTWR